MELEHMSIYIISIYIMNTTAINECATCGTESRMNETVTDEPASINQDTTLYNEENTEINETFKRKKRRLIIKWWMQTIELS